MSGEPRVVLGGNVQPLVAILEVVTRVLGTEGTLVGGLAVMTRLMQVHRPTLDVDFATGDIDAAELLVKNGVGERDPSHPGRVLVGDTKVDLIQTSEVPDDLSGIDRMDRLYLLSHRWATESAEWCRVSVVGTKIEARARVATPAALVAMKLHSLHTRRAASAHKRSSDAYDLYRLLHGCDADGSVAAAYDAAPAELRGIVGEAARQAFVADAEDTVRVLRRGGDQPYREIDADDLTRVGAPFAAALTR